MRDGQTVMIDIGTTTLQAAHHLRGSRITVVTSSLAVYEELVPDPAIELLLPGGVVRRNYRSLVGVLAEDSLRQLKADVAVPRHERASTSELAVWDSTMVEVPIKRAMIAAAGPRRAARRRGEVRDGGHRARLRGGAIDQIVTDDALPASARAAIDEAGIEVTIA